MENKCIFCDFSNLEKLELPYNTGKWSRGDHAIEKIDGEINRAICHECGMVQFIQNKDYTNSVNKIFLTYNHVPEKIIDENTTLVKKICESLENKIEINDRGKILDLGCAAGDFLISFKERHPGWLLYGMDIGEHNRNIAISNGVDEFYESLTEVANISQRYDLISMNCVFSLVDEPGSFLRFIHDNLSPNGYGVIVESDYRKQPFLNTYIEARALITRDNLTYILEKNGFEIVDDLFNNDFKKIGLIFRVRKNAKTPKLIDAYEINKREYEKIYYIITW